jgi:predicted O-methyltransferase YrrM
MTRRRRWHLLLVAVVGAVSGAAAGVAWLRLAVLPFRGLDPSPALAVVRHLEANGGLRAADGRLLYDQIVGRGYRRGLDLGTAEGCSALWMAMALRKSGGSLVTIEIDPATAERARQNFRRAGMDDLVELRVADALEEVPRVAGEFDCVFMDVGVPLNKKLLDLLRARIRPGGVVMAHNAEAFRWTQPDFLDAITDDPQLETSFQGLIFKVSISVKRY